MSLDNDTWQQHDAPMANGSAPGPAGGDEGWGGAGGATPPGRRNSPPPRRSRSKSPGRGRGEGRGDGDGGANPGNNLHVSGLHHKIDDRELTNIFSKIGKVKKAAVMLDPHSRESRGFGFVTMEAPEDAEAAIAQLNASEVLGKLMNVEKARRGRARTPTPGRYYGPPKRLDSGPYYRPAERPYDPRPYDSRYGGYDDRYGGRGGGYDRYGPPRDYDRRGGGYGGRYDDRRGYDDYPPRRDYDRRY